MTLLTWCRLWHPILWVCLPFAVFRFLTLPLYSMSAHIFSPSAVCSCDPCLWKGCGAVPVCVLVCLDVGGNAVGWDYCGIYVLWKIPSPCFHGNPSISVNPGDSEQASNLWHDLSPHLSSGNPAAQNEVNWKHNSEAWVFDHLPNSCLFSQIWVDDARWMQCSDDSVRENCLCVQTLIHMMKITDVSASPVKVMKGFCMTESF